MPSRILREGILSSERVDLLSAPAEVFYRRLMSAVDDYGRFYAKPELLRAACFPLKLNKVGNPDIGKWILETREAALVRTYTVDGKEYLEMLDFKQQVRTKVSKFPPPPGPAANNAQQMQSTCVADAQHLHTKAEAKSYSNLKSSSVARATTGKTAAAAALSNGLFYPEKLTSAERREAAKVLNGHPHAQFMLDELAGAMASKAGVGKPIAMLVHFKKQETAGTMSYSHASQIQAARELAQVEAELAAAGKSDVLERQ